MQGEGGLKQPRHAAVSKNGLSLRMNEEKDTCGGGAVQEFEEVHILCIKRNYPDPPPRVMKIKTEINKWDLMKLKSFCTAKETINKMKRQPSEWETISANEATDKRLISKI